MYANAGSHKARDYGSLFTLQRIHKRIPLSSKFANVLKSKILKKKQFILFEIPILYQFEISNL